MGKDDEFFTYILKFEFFLLKSNNKKGKQNFIVSLNLLSNELEEKERKEIAQTEIANITKMFNENGIFVENIIQQTLCYGVTFPENSLEREQKMKDYEQFIEKRIEELLLEDTDFDELLNKITDDNDDTLLIPYSYLFASEHKRISIKIPTILKNKKIKEIRIIPKLKARYFEIQYVYESKIEKLNLNKENALGIDLGINNFCTCVTNNGRSFIIDGRKLKSINQFYNKRNASLQALKDTKKKIKGKIKLLQAKIAMKRNNRVNDYLSKTARTIINYCIENDIGKIVIGYNVTFQRNSNIGKVNNQNFVNIPYGKLRNKLEYLCDMYGIEYILQEESYTSKASFFDRDDLPLYNADNPQEYIFSGRRVKRGLYMTKKGNLINADCNGALNILRKSNVVDLNVLCDRGGLDTPKRIRII